MDFGHIETDGTHTSSLLIPAAGALSNAAALAICYHLTWIFLPLPYHKTPLPVFWLFHVLFLSLFSSRQLLHPDKDCSARLPGPPAEETRKLVFAVTGSSTAVWLLSILMLPDGNRHALELALVCLLAFFAVPAVRCGIITLISRRAWWWKPCLVSGTAQEVKSVLSALKTHPCIGFKPAVVYTPDSVDTPSLSREQMVITDDLGLALDHAREKKIGLALISGNENRSETDSNALKSLRETTGAAVLEYALGSTGIVAIWNALETARKTTNLLHLRRHSAAAGTSKTIKSLLTLVLLIALLPMLVPLLAILAILVKLTSRGPIFYGQERVGRSGQKFTMWKFRTMVTDAEKILQDHLSRHPELREEWNEDRKLRDDPRVTDFGRLLRLTSLDELPQLWNILKREMTLVGPRAITESEILNYGDSFEQYKCVRPGVTGLWQVSGRNNISYPERVCLDAHYVQNWSAWLEIYILAKTPLVVFSCQGAY